MPFRLCVRLNVSTDFLLKSPIPCCAVAFPNSLEFVCKRCHDSYQILMCDLIKFLCTEQLPEHNEDEEPEEGDPRAVIIYGTSDRVHRALGLPAVANLIMPPGIVPPRIPLQQGKKVTIHVYECCSVMLIAVHGFRGLIFLEHSCP